MEMYDLILNRRSVRKFKQNKINIATLRKIVDAGRAAPSAANLQFIEYIIASGEEVEPRFFLIPNGLHIFSRRIGLTLESAPVFILLF